MCRLILPPRFDAASALRRFRRRRFLNLYGLIPSRPVRQAPGGAPLSIELVWMPAYAFRFPLNHGGGKRSHAWVCVDASYGGSAIFGRVSALEEQEPEGECFAPSLDHDAAVDLAREGVLRFILKKRGAKPGVEPFDEELLYYAPVWVYYYRRLGGKIDFAILDGYSGDTMGGRVRQAIINGFIAKRKQDNPAAKA